MENQQPQKPHWKKEVLISVVIEGQQKVIKQPLWWIMEMFGIERLK